MADYARVMANLAGGKQIVPTGGYKPEVNEKDKIQSSANRGNNGSEDGQVQVSINFSAKEL